MFNDISSLSAYLKSRRSGRPRDMVAPGPSHADISEIVETALRSPDHGKLAPWRVIAVAEEQRAALTAGISGAYLTEKPEAGRLELDALKNIAHEAPALLVVLFSPKASSKIPMWEQELSCGAFCMNIIHAIHSKGFVGSWITGWSAYNEQVRDLFGGADERIAGFIFAGSADAELAERPRPELSDILSQWNPPKTLV